MTENMPYEAAHDVLRESDEHICPLLRWVDEIMDRVIDPVDIESRNLEVACAASGGLMATAFSETRSSDSIYSNCFVRAIGRYRPFSGLG